jgi:hypothetical protein
LEHSRRSTIRAATKNLRSILLALITRLRAAVIIQSQRAAVIIRSQRAAAIIRSQKAAAIIRSQKAPAAALELEAVATRRDAALLLHADARTAVMVKMKLPSMMNSRQVLSLAALV